MPAETWLDDLVADVKTRAPMTPGTLTSTMGRRDHPVGMFLRALTANGVRALTQPTAASTPLLVSTDGLAPGEHSTIGTAFGWLLRLRLDPHPDLHEARAARELLPPHVQLALWELDTWILDRTQLDEPGDDQRAAVVLAWCEQLFRAGPAALAPCPLLRLAPGDGPAEVLDLVPDRCDDQLGRLFAVAQDRLTPLLQPATTRLGVPLNRPPIAADADVITGSLLLELKCGKGSARAGGQTFPLSVELLRQLLGYALLVDAGAGVERVGLYAARFGLTWTMPVVDLIEAGCGRRVHLAQAREAFARLFSAA